MYEYSFRGSDLLPYFDMYGGGKYVFIPNPDVGPPAVIVILGTIGFLFSRWNNDFENSTPFHGVDVHFTIYLRFAVKFCGSLDHVNLLFRANSGNLAVILYSYEQSSPVRVGECGKGFSDLASIGNLEFEILLLVFSLCNSGVYLVGFCLNHSLVVFLRLQRYCNRIVCSLFKEILSYLCQIILSYGSA